MLDFGFLYCELEDDEEETKCSQEKVFNKRLEIDDDEDDDTGIDNHGKNGNACLMDSPLQHVADKAITGYAECIDSDFDLKVIAQCSLLSLLSFYLPCFYLYKALLFMTLLIEFGFRIRVLICFLMMTMIVVK